MSLQPGDVSDANADVDDLINAVEFKPYIPIEWGIDKFVELFNRYIKTIEDA